MKIRKSKSGFYKVELSRPFPRRGFTYKPGTTIQRCSQQLLDEMVAADVVESAVAVD